MPFGPSTKQKSSKKKKSGGGWGHFGFLKTAARGVGHVGAGTGKGFYKGITGLPTGVYMGGRAVGHDVGQVIRHPMSPHHWTHTTAIAKALAKAEVEQYRHFGRGGDISGPLLDALAVLSAGSGAAGKVGAVSKAARGGEGLRTALRATHGPYDRAIPGTPYRIPASPNPAIRGVQKLALKNPRIAKRALERRQWQAERFARQLAGKEKEVPYSGKVELPPGVKVSHTESKPGRVVKSSLIKKVANVPMDVLRIAMWLRPRYYLQNVEQTGTMLASRPITSARSIGKAVKLGKNDRALYADFKNMVGEGQAMSLTEGRFGAGRTVEHGVPKGMGKFKKGERMHTVGRAVNAPEAHVRVISGLNEFHRAGIRTRAQMKDAMAQLKSGHPSSKVLNAAIRANEEVGDFGRLSKAERNFIKSQVPIFYPMFKALTRYTARYPSEHSILAAGQLHLGQEGKKEQHRLLGDLPFWAQYNIPKKAGDPRAKMEKSPQVYNPGTVYNYQPGTDIARQTVEMFRPGGGIPGLNLLQEFGPLPQLGYGASTGKDLQTGFPIRGIRPSKEHPNARQQSNIEAAVRDFLFNLPGSELPKTMAGFRPNVRSYEKNSALRQLMMEIFGPAHVSRRQVLVETQKQAKREKQSGKGRKKRKKTPYYG